MRRSILLLFVLFAGCIASKHVDLSTEPPELVSLAPLPARPSYALERGLKLEVLMHIMSDGTVEYAELHGSSGDVGWDSLAVQAIKKWRFIAAKRNGVPIDLWIRQQITVQFEEPLRMVLAELACTSQRQADSIYSLIQAGADFDTLARQLSESSSGGRGGVIGTVDITMYPPHVRDELKRLDGGATTRPLRVGGNYMIYKRLKRDAVRGPLI
jgi:TonB family protein